MQHVSISSDVVVVGGGLAGVAAAIGAARAGARVSLVNNRPVLGGNASSEVRVWVCGATAHGAQKYARETGIMGELFLENQYRNPEGNPYLWDQVVLDAVRAEPLVDLYLNTDVREVDADGPDDDRTIRSVTGWQMGSEKVVTFVGDVFVDATGDGLVGHLAGAWYRTGREAADEFGEDWAPQVPDDNMLGSTMFFYTKDTGQPVRFVPPSIAKDITGTTIVKNRPIHSTANGCDYWWIEWGGEFDAVGDAELIRDELWAVVYGIWDHIKNSGEFDADNLTLEWVGSVPGKREYRRFVGDHVLTQQDVMDQVRFDDAVGFGGWSIDLHPPGGMYADEDGSKHLFSAGVYSIPFRSLYSANVRNMLMAGRNISATHVAFGSTRVMATCAVTGEAAGVGAALSARHHVSPRVLVTDRLAELHQTLLRHDASLLGVPWDHPDDVAGHAEVTASSTLTALEVTPGSELEPLDGRDLGVLVPVDPALGSVTMLLVADRATALEVELWSTGGGENHIPVRHLRSTTVVVPASGRQWVTAHLPYAPERPENVVVVLRRNPDLAVVLSDGAGPYGMLGLISRDPRVVTGRPQANAWSAAELRRRTPVLHVDGPTRAFAPARVVGGLQRPFDGPQLWSSQAMLPGRDESLTLTWPGPQAVGSVEILFNDDVDEDLINLHHHRTPFEVIPELVKDYRLELRGPDGWMTAVRVLDNRVRRRVHRLDGTATALRVVVEATNGSPWASVVAVRVFP